MSNRNRLQEMCSGPEFAFGEMYAIRQFKLDLNPDFPNDDVWGLGAVMHDSYWTPGEEATCAMGKITVHQDFYEAVEQFLEQHPEMKDDLGFELLPIEYEYDWNASSNYYYGTYSNGSISHTVTANSRHSPKYYARVKHNTPKPDCTCGYYAYHSLKALNENRYSSTDFTGVIRAHGRIVIGSKGIRAQKADILALTPDFDFYLHTSDEKSTRADPVLVAAMNKKAYAFIENAVTNSIELGKITPRENSFLKSPTNIKDINRLIELIDLEAAAEELDKSGMRAGVYGTKSENKLNYVDFNMMYLVSARRDRFKKEMTELRRGLVQHLTDLYVDEELEKDENPMTADPNYSRIAHLVNKKRDHGTIKALLDIARSYPNAVFFKTVHEMLEQFPLTGAEDFMPMNEDDLL